MSYSEMFPSVCCEISRLCQDAGHVLMLGQIAAGSPEERVRQAKSLAEKFADQGVMGVIFQPVGFLPDADRLSADVVGVFSRKGIPVVLIDGEDFGGRYALVAAGGQLRLIPVGTGVIIR
jgi:DNA-binding LacI/PurR family transcriptional regulator